jgi:hypothetical protein
MHKSDGFCHMPKGYARWLPKFLAVDPTHGVNQKYGNTPKLDILESTDRGVIVGRLFLTTSTVDRPRISPRSDLDFHFLIFVETDVRIDKSLVLFNAIKDSLQLHLESSGSVE